MPVLSHDVRNGPVGLDVVTAPRSSPNDRDGRSPRSNERRCTVTLQPCGDLGPSVLVLRKQHITSAGVWATRIQCSLAQIVTEYAEAECFSGLTLFLRPLLVEALGHSISDTSPHQLRWERGNEGTAGD